MVGIPSTPFRAPESASETGASAVQVAVRLRPDAVEDPMQAASRFMRPAVTATSLTSVLVEPSIQVTSSRESRHSFSFDRVFDVDAAQTTVYQTSVAPLVQRFLDGYNTTIFAYGQTSSGKSYSMGTSEESETLLLEEEDMDELGDRIGIIPRAARQIFHTLRDMSDPDSEYKLTVSFLELYNEDLIDLLSDPIDEPCQVQIRETRAGEIVWMGLRQHAVASEHEVVRLLQDGMAMRQTHETEMNAQSSRSHAIFSITLTRQRRTVQERAPSSLGQETIVTTTSKLHFVDLAGSERLKRTAATGDRAREGIAINSGLHALGNVISILSDPARSKRAVHVPYRDSKLTRLLQDSLGGNAHTLMIACVSSTEGNVSETLNTLQYAQRARRIRNTVERNQVEAGWDNLEYLQGLVTRLRKELDLVRSSNELVLASPEKMSAPMESEWQRELLAWQEKCTALSRKNVQLSAELVQLEQGRNGGSNDFLEAAEPVIVEYEKTVDALEGQINMLKASVAYSEQLLRDQAMELEAAKERAHQADEKLEVMRRDMAALQAKVYN
ncbi:kinesin-like protein [Malassezia pachydermatis]|uniref:Kinesin-like protein n=1 Tax=Malassezia pachydermatis TaxID=77020 RepID=A0A0N0RSD5_9BASI|nr:kinesin-like protein [Malassezia pachydermatis]KOS14795.1 kinesin-like protein [Malassezia pachydermatis]